MSYLPYLLLALAGPAAAAAIAYTLAASAPARTRKDNR